MEKYYDIVFDGPPSHESGRFVEVENSEGKSIRIGDWIEDDDGYWRLRIPTENEKPKAEIKGVITCKDCEWIETLGKPQSNREYWIITEIFVKLHGGKDYCAKTLKEEE